MMQPMTDPYRNSRAPEWPGSTRTRPCKGCGVDVNQPEDRRRKRLYCSPPCRLQRPQVASMSEGPAV